jgi:NADPH dehydrogenase (quinone)
MDCFNPSYQMKILLINTHLTYPGWSEGKVNLAFMDLAKAFFIERGHQVAETLSSGPMTSRKR